MKSTHKKSKGGKGPRDVQVSAIADGTKLSPARWLVPVIGVLLIGAAFLPALQNGFVWDDDRNFLLNPHYRGLGLDELRWMFTPFWGHYTPLTWLTLGLDYLLWGMDPWGYHLSNVLLHVATAVAFYFLTIQLLRLATGDGGKDKALWAGAAFAALFFAVHPLRVESVAWITERRDVLSGLFYVLTILAYLRAVDRVGQGARWYWVSVVLFACALLSKAMAISLPVVLLILDVYPLRRLGGPVGWWSASARHVYTEKIPFVLLAGVASAVALAALFHTLGTSSSMDWVSPLDRLSISGYGLGFYLWKTVAPLTLSPLYELPIKINPWSPTFIWNYILVLIFIVATFALRHRLPGLLAAWLAYVVILLPVIGIVQNGDHIAADRYTYLACLGWAIMAGAGIFYCWRLWVRRRIGLRTFVFINGVAVMVVVGLGGLTWKQTQIWHNSERLWRHAVSAGPESKKAHYNLGNALLKRGELGEAIKHYREVLRIYPASADVHNNLGNAMFNRGELGKAIKHYRQALRINPAYAKAHNNLAVALLNEGKLTEATEHFCQSVRLGYAQAQKNLTIALTRLGEREDAVKRCRKP
ncbi:MAG: tetratricopeptide repeat protein [Deltaproteobacteria bacterium]|nr:tetratricopeptide repeat protein [Deltaproteobacteria bacterium]